MGFTYANGIDLSPFKSGDKDKITRLLIDIYLCAPKMVAYDHDYDDKFAKNTAKKIVKLIHHNDDKDIDVLAQVIFERLASYMGCEINEVTNSTFIERVRKHNRDNAEVCSNVLCEFLNKHVNNQD